MITIVFILVITFINKADNKMFRKYMNIFLT